MKNVENKINDRVNPMLAPIDDIIEKVPVNQESSEENSQITLGKAAMENFRKAYIAGEQIDEIGNNVQLG